VSLPLLQEPARDEGLLAASDGAGLDWLLCPLIGARREERGAGCGGRGEVTRDPFHFCLDPSTSLVLLWVRLFPTAFSVSL